MLTEKEFNIIKTLVEEEMGYVAVSDDTSDTSILNKYFSTLADIIEKLKCCSENTGIINERTPLSVR